MSKPIRQFVSFWLTFQNSRLFNNLSFDSGIRRKSADSCQTPQVKRRGGLLVCRAF